MEEFKILKDLVKFNTIKDKENKEIINYLESYLEELGFKTEYKTKDLVMSIGKDPKLGFLGHTDTVEYIEEFKNPFDLTLKDGFLYGLGACDMKGGIAAMLNACKEIDFNKFKYGMKMYFTYDEEIGFSGINELVDNKEDFPEYMIFGEPTDNEIFIGHKGLIEYEIGFKGIKAHASRPDKGISANMNAVKFLYKLNDFYEKKIKTDLEEKYDIPYTTMNVGIINGGSAINSISAFCKVYIDFRLAKKSHIEIIQNEIKKLAEEHDAEVCEKEKIEPFSNEIDFLKNAKTCNLMTEASMVINSKRMILGLGPITAHEVDEKISVDSYNKLVEQYKDLIYKICK